MLKAIIPHAFLSCHMKIGTTFKNDPVRVPGFTPAPKLYWGYTRVILGLNWGYITAYTGVILGLHWDYIGVK